ncbi:hypothetical protein [Dictyobacter kobayashii]|uniref:Uncharacterized protein n=1 Tax=Dictyobacter kobayashii TaxID=2014872 RepID=A0A402AW16_9CHLR|nr:hypothetical protein [Dictyobacter kobayashii]GCE23321.1 hypothetical protein KDK_71210 [Dictyobacter kobayashii]
MPKETKKFINPLLRPSQAAESRTVSPPAEVVDEPVEEVAQEVKEEKPVAQVEPAPLEAATEVPAQAESIQSAPIAKETPTKKARPTAENDSEKAFAAEETRINARREASTTSLPARSDPKARDVTPPRSRQSATRSEAAPYVKNHDSSGLKLTDFPENNFLLDEDYATYDPSTSSEDGRGAAKRRRSLQPFESTHERITLWMDKQLKQQFEELALQRELPKTALINEAVAALLDKYGAR